MRSMASREAFQPKALRRNRVRKAQGVAVAVVVGTFCHGVGRLL